MPTGKSSHSIFSAGLLAALALGAGALLPACGGGANSPAGGTGSGGATPTGSGGTAATGSGGAPPATGTGGSGMPVGDAGAACSTHASFTLAIHIVLNINWPDSMGTNAGTGQLHVWNLARMTADGMSLTSMTRPCGSTLPELAWKPLVGGGKTQLEIPDSAWDAPGAPFFPAVGTLAGWTVGSALHTDTTNVLVGMTLADPNGAWPDSYTMVTAVDSDADGQPGITSLPRGGTGYVLPPVATPILGLGPKADKVYLVSRTAVALTGALTSCTELAGTVTPKFFDSHIVGCHVSGGDACSATQVEFVDGNRTKYTATGGTFTAKILADGATCADVHAAMGAQP